MKLLLTSILLLAVTVNAWPLKKDDTEELKKQIEVKANKNLGEFIMDVKDNDVAKIKQNLVDLKQIVEDVQKNNHKLIPFINGVVGTLNFYANRDLKCLWGGLLHLTVAAVDGNRDNYSYYTFEAAKEWIKRRVNDTHDPLKQGLDDSFNKINAAQEDLDSHAQVFVSGIKKLNELSSGGKAGKNQEEIRKVVAELVHNKEDGKLLEKTDAAIAQIQTTTDNVK